MLHTPKGLKEPIVHIIFYRLTECLLLVRFLRLGTDLRVTFTFDHFSYMTIWFCFFWVHFQFFQLLPVIGPLAVSLQRLLLNPAAFMILFAMFSTFMIIFFKLINPGKVECVEDFSSMLMSTYSTFLVLVNLLHFRTFEVEAEVCLYTSHVIYVYMGPIMLINFLIGTFS